MSAGNVKKTPFKKIWFESPLFQDLRNFKGYKGKCGTCEFLNVCGGCRARAYAVTGDYLDEEPFCNYVPVRPERERRVGARKVGARKVGARKV
jgi:MoaA/NifB/PqqE/SkfB family radical SAM enzyme